jgi:hypothetical protein
MLYVRINKIKVFNNREEFLRLFPDQRTVYDPVNDNDASMNRVNDGEAPVHDMPGITSVYNKHISVGGYGENTGLALKGSDLVIYSAQEIFGGNGSREGRPDVSVYGSNVFIGLGCNFDNIRFHRVIFRPKSLYMASSKFFLNSFSEISSSSGTGKGVLSKSSTIWATRGCFAMSLSIRRPVLELLSIITVVMSIYILSTAQKYENF